MLRIPFFPIWVIGLLFMAAGWSQAPTYISAVGYAFPNTQAVAQGQVVTLFVHGLTAANAKADTFPLPNTLSGVTVNVTSPANPDYPKALPIFSVVSSPDRCSNGALAYCDTTAVTVQIPFEPPCVRTAGDFPNPCSYVPPVKAVVHAAGTASQEFSLAVRQQLPHILTSCDVPFETGEVCHPMITHSDGTLVSTAVSTAGRARPGEVITVYAVGLGPTKGNAKTGIATASADPIVADVFVTALFRVDTPPGTGYPLLSFMDLGRSIPPDFVALVKGYVGLYQINVKLPDALPAGTHACDSFGDINLRLVVANESADICVGP